MAGEKSWRDLAEAAREVQYDLHRLRPSVCVQPRWRVPRWILRLRFLLYLVAFTAMLAADQIPAMNTDSDDEHRPGSRVPAPKTTRRPVEGVAVELTSTPAPVVGVAGIVRPAERAKPRPTAKPEPEPTATPPVVPVSPPPTPGPLIPLDDGCGKDKGHIPKPCLGAG